MSVYETHHEAQFCVVGGGMAGLHAAITAARCGLKTILMHDRPVLGGNASSEIRMWVCGAGWIDVRETGLIEEINLLNLYRNPYKNYYLWDTVLLEKARSEPNLTLLLNCSCLSAQTDCGEITSVTGWQTTTYTRHTVHAKYFADCSGDSILASVAGAEYMLGRESKYEYNEPSELEAADKKTMGNSCLLQARKLRHKTSFTPPDWARKITSADLDKRKINLEYSGENFWYLELGGDRDVLKDAEEIRDELVALSLGIWDYIKNSGDIENAEYWYLEFLGFLPGKRESRRLKGDYVMTANDILSGGVFEDTVAYGGWALDDHNPEGFDSMLPPNRITKVPGIYGIPYRVLYSKNIKNLFFAGRNISMTHLAMSSARVMATCSVLGQAIGTAAYVADKYGTTPQGVLDHMNEVQQHLLFNDCFIPRVQREVSGLAKNTAVQSSVSDKDASIVKDGCDRNIDNQEHLFITRKGDELRYVFERPEIINGVKLVFDSDLNRTSLPGDANERNHSMRCNIGEDAPVMTMPATLIKGYDVEYTNTDGQVITLKSEKNNILRSVILNCRVEATSITLRLNESWGGGDSVQLFTFEPI